MQRQAERSSYHPDTRGVRSNLQILVLAWVAALTLYPIPAMAQFRVVTYNVADLIGDQPSLRLVLSALVDDFAPGSGTIRAPDILLFQEVDGNIARTLTGYLNDAAPPGVEYELGTFTANGGGGGENAVIYNLNTVIEHPSGHRDILDHTGPRATDRWEFSIVGQFGGQVFVYGSHLKADTGPSNEAMRLSEADAIRRDADSLGDGVHIIYGGDYNFKSADEPGFLRFFDPGPGRAVDPLFEGNFSNPLAHSQSPHDGSIQGLTTGGMDDRFDFLLMTEEFFNDAVIDVDRLTYRSFGNDGRHYNKAINDGFNSYFLDDEQAVKADALARASDHLPVAADFLLDGYFFRQFVGPLEVGAFSQWRVEGAVPNRAVYFIYSFQGLGRFDVAPLDVTLRLAAPKLAASKRPKANGTASIVVHPPDPLAGTAIWLQTAQVGAVSDVVLRVVR